MTGTQTPIKLYDNEFEAVRKDIIETHGISGILSWVLKRDQGWSYRNRGWNEPVSIDFWSESAKSMFLLKYSHLITKSLKTLNKNSG